MNMGILRRTAALFTLGALCCSLFSCAASKWEYTYLCGEKIHFAGEKEAEKWREPLEKLLSNVDATIYSDDAIGAIIGHKPPNPEYPSIADGCACALYDLNLDGVPELLVDLGGGSAGNSYYQVYDIYTGENLYSIDGAQSGSLCVYYDTERKGIVNVNKFSWRSGWSGKMCFTNIFAGESEEWSKCLFASYSMDMVEISEGNYDIVCTGARFELDGESIDTERYLFEIDNFEKNYIRIKETELSYIYWWDVAEDEDTPDVKGEKMAEALLSSGQKFVFYGE